MSDERVSGQCLCGAVKVEGTPVPDGTPAGNGLGACHCDMCRRWTSSVYVEIALAKDTLKVEGPVKTFTSSEWAERAFCETCGSPLWYKLTIEGTESEPLQVSAGLFENAANRELSLEVFIDRKPDGYAFAGDHKSFTEAEIFAMYAPPPEGGEP
jgi:hypothetical protein